MKRGEAYIVPGGMCRKGLKTIRHPWRNELMWNDFFLLLLQNIIDFELSSAMTPHGDHVNMTCSTWKRIRQRAREPLMRSAGSKHGALYL